MAETGDPCALSEGRRQLRLVFTEPAKLQVEYARNLRKGGAFVPTLEHFEMREMVDVSVELPFADRRFTLAAEVVLCMPPEMAPPGADPGIAVQFIEDAEAIRERVAPYLSADELARTEELVLNRPVDSASSPPAGEAKRRAPPGPDRGDELEFDEGDGEPALEFDPNDFNAFEAAPAAAGVQPAAAESLELERDPDFEPAPGADAWELEALAAETPSLEFDAAPEAAPPGATAPSVEFGEPGAAPKPETPAPALEASMGSIPMRPSWQPITGYAVQDERRDSPREVARLPVRVRTATGLEMEARTRDLSRSGALLSVEGTEIPLGRRLQLRFLHPLTGQVLEVAGRAVRHVEGEGTIPAAAVRFEPSLGQSAQVAQFVDEMQQLEEQRRREGIRGPIEEMGVASLLQMFASCSPRGTVTLSRGAEEGTVVFDQKRLLLVRLGPVTGTKALARLLAWKDGEFEYRTHVDETTDRDEEISLEEALLEAARQVDEEQRRETPEFPPGAELGIDRERLVTAGSPLTQIEEAVVDLAAAGFTVRRILDVIPQSDADIQACIAGLVERGILALRPPS